MKTFIKKFGVLSASILLIGFFGIYTNAQTDMSGYSILPDLDEKDINEINKAITTIGSSGGHVMEKYNEQAEKFSTADQIASGIMNRDTIMNYLVYVIKFLSQIGLALGALFIMYAGIQYMISVFKGNKTPTGTIKNAILGVIIVIFSYAILKAMMSLVGLE